MKIMVTSLKKSHEVLPHSALPTLQQATADPRLYRRLLDTHRQIRGSLLWGHCSFLLGPGAHKVLLCPPRVYFSVLCKFWQLCGGVNGDFSKRAYVIPKSAAPRAPSQWQSTADPHLHRRRSNTVLSQSLKIFYFVDIILL